MGIQGSCIKQTFKVTHKNTFLVLCNFLSGWRPAGLLKFHKSGVFPSSLNTIWEFWGLPYNRTSRWPRKINFWFYVMIWFDAVPKTCGLINISLGVWINYLDYLEPLGLRCLVFCVVWCGAVGLVNGMHFSQSKNALLLNFTHQYDLMHSLGLQGPEKSRSECRRDIFFIIYVRQEEGNKISTSLLLEG